MKNQNLAERLAVCSWSLQPTGPDDLLAKLQQTGIKRLQLALDPMRNDEKNWGRAVEVLRRGGAMVVSGMFGCVGEDYSTLASIRATGGIAPDATWEQNQKNIQATAALAKQLGLKLVTFHAGFLPHDAKDPDFRKMLERLSEVADTFARAQIVLGLETGQETAPDLRNVLEQLKRPNVAVNFDPANMILYDKGDPVEAVKVLGQWIRQVHVKDARRTRTPGTWGEEVAVGTGEVNWRAFFDALGATNFKDDLVIEREAGNQRVQDIRSAKQHLEQL